MFGNFQTNENYEKSKLIRKYKQVWSKFMIFNKFQSILKNVPKNMLKNVLLTFFYKQKYNHQQSPIVCPHWL